MTRDSVIVWQPREVEGLLAIHAQYRTQRFPRHVHEEHVIGVNEGGAHTFYCRGSVHTVEPGCIALINPGDVHTGEPAGQQEWNYRGFYPTVALIRQLWEEGTNGCGLPAIQFDRPVVRDPVLAAALIRASRVTERAHDTFATETALVDVMTALLVRHASPRRSRVAAAVPRTVAHLVRDYIHAHALAPISLERLGAAVGVGRSSVVRAFRREFGMAPYEYVVTLRVAHARLLIQRRTSLAAVALACGFNHQSHLHRHFRRLVGVAPGAYARALAP
jgi:AraC-like DNA-binding protein